MNIPTNDCGDIGFELVEGHIALVTLRRAHKRNAITAEMAVALERCLEVIEADLEIHAAILTGDGPVFCAGADLGDIAVGRGDRLRTAAGGFAGLVDARRTKPWIAAVGGSALAGGFEIALSCDIIIAASDASFALPEVRRGLVASAGGVYRLPRALPRHVALDLIATGMPLSAERAFSLGLASQLVPNDQLLAAALDKARIIAANSPRAMRESLAIARVAATAPEADIRKLAKDAGDRMLASADAREGARAFLEKRTPSWPSDAG